jgi:Putative beta-barrel porin 2
MPKQFTSLLGFILLSAAFSHQITFAQDYFREFDTRTRFETEPVPEEPAVDPMEADVPLPLEAEESIYPAPETEPIITTPTEPEEKYNLKLGPVLFNAAVGVGLEYNDNIELAPPGEEESDLIFRPSVTVDAVWPITELNTLRFTVGASYAKYFEHSEFDSRSLLLSPSSVLQLTVHVGEVVFNLYDRFSYQEDPFDLPVLAGVATYRRFENAAGIQASWEVNPLLTLTAGFEHYNLWTFDDEFSVLDRSVETFYFRPQFELSPAVTVGLNTMVSFVNYSDDFQNDGTSYIVAPFVDIELTSSTRVFVEAGYQFFSFDSGGEIADNEDGSGFYGRFEINNVLTDYYRHRLSGSKTTETGFTSNFYELYHVEYSADWSVMPSLVLSPTLFYEHYETSGEQSEAADRLGAAVGLRYILTPSVTMGVDYRFVYKDSDLEDADYRQNLVLLTLFYNF